jgi:hypothetical protein
MFKFLLTTAILVATSLANAQPAPPPPPHASLGAVQFECVQGSYNPGTEPFPIIFTPSGINTAEGIGPLATNFTTLVIQPGLYFVQWFYGINWSTIAYPPIFLSGSGKAPWITTVPNDQSYFESPGNLQGTIAGFTQGGLMQVTSPNSVIEFPAYSNNIGACEVVIIQLQ